MLLLWGLNIAGIQHGRIGRNPGRSCHVLPIWTQPLRVSPRVRRRIGGHKKICGLIQTADSPRAAAVEAVVNKKRGITPPRQRRLNDRHCATGQGGVFGG